MDWSLKNHCDDDDEKYNSWNNIYHFENKVLNRKICPMEFCLFIIFIFLFAVHIRLQYVSPKWTHFVDGIIFWYTLNKERRFMVGLISFLLKIGPDSGFVIKTNVPHPSFP